MKVQEGYGEKFLGMVTECEHITKIHLQSTPPERASQGSRDQMAYSIAVGSLASLPCTVLMR